MAGNIVVCCCVVDARHPDTSHDPRPVGPYSRPLDPLRALSYSPNPLPPTPPPQPKKQRPINLKREVPRADVGQTQRSRHDLIVLDVVFTDALSAG